jgi:hypothetical protein
VEITILIESTDPLTGRIVATIDDRPDDPSTDTSFQGWIGLLRALEDLVDHSPGPPQDVG